MDAGTRRRNVQRIANVFVCVFVCNGEGLGERGGGNVCLKVFQTAKSATKRILIHMYEYAAMDHKRLVNHVRGLGYISSHTGS